MTEKRYRLDTECIIDQKTGEILTTRKAVNRLNRQDALIEAKREQIKFHVDGYNQLEKEKERLYDDNIRIKQLITEAHSNERTAIGRSVLLQIIEQL